MKTAAAFGESVDFARPSVSTQPDGGARAGRDLGTRDTADGLGTRDTADGLAGIPKMITEADSESMSGTRRTFARLRDGDGENNWRPVDKVARLSSGKRIPGTRYRLMGWLGEGGMGEVFEGIHVDIERRVALKIVKRGTDEALSRQFIEEARTIARIDSRFVVDVLDFGELPDGRPFYAMELLQDYSLHSVLDHEGRLPLERAIPILRQLCKALTAIHACGLAHRDLKPENILLQTQGGRGDMVRVVDFGISADFKPRALQIAGTPLYMAPEQIMGEGFDGRLDIYALGCLAYEIISGEPPFNGAPLEIFGQHLDARPDSLTGRLPDLPEQLDEVLARCMAKRPEDRYASAVELETALCEIQIAAGFTTPWDDLALPEISPEGREELAQLMPRPRSKAAIDPRILAGVGIAAVLAATAWIAWPDNSNSRTADEIASNRAWVDEYAAEARAAAGQAYWVYPPADDREFKTAQVWVDAIEDKAGVGDYVARSQADLLRAEFAATLVRLGDEYWDEEHGRPFAVDYYAQALMFEPNNTHADARVAMTAAQRAEAKARAARGEFSDAELAAGEMLAALAEPNETKRRARVVSLVEEDQRGIGGAHTQDLLLGLVGAEEAKAEVAEAIAAGALPGSEEAESGPATTVNAKRARELAEQGRKALDKGKRDKAERLFHKAVESDQRNVTAVSGLAQLHFDQGDYGEALGYAKKAAKLRPRDEDVRLLLGDTYLKVLRYSAARIQYQKAQELGHSMATKRLERLDQLTK